MKIVLTMAGKYNRFRLFGNMVPKYLLPLGSETMLAEVIKQFSISAPTCEFLLIANRRDQTFFPILSSIMRRYSIREGSLIFVDDTSSQLETALHARDLFLPKDLDKPVAIANIDTILFRREPFFEKLKACPYDQACLDTFCGESKEYSFARVEVNGMVSDVVDKNAISSNACSGLYGFGSFSKMEEIGGLLLRSHHGANFTDLYKKYIELELQVFNNHVEDRRDTIVLGTPEEYTINMNRFKT